MAGETIITVVGNLTADPEIRTTGSGASVASFTIASTPRTWNRNTNQFEDGQALFMRCSAWHGWSVWQSVLRSGGLYGRGHRCRRLASAVRPVGSATGQIGIVR